MLKKLAPHGVWITHIMVIGLMSIAGRDLLRLSQCCIQGSQLSWLLSAGFLLLLIAVLFFLSQERQIKIPWRIVIPLGVIFLGLPFLIPTVEERLHLLLFSSLGFFCARSIPSSKALVVALACGFGDEVLQHFLIDRVGDWRDVLFNCGSASFGFALYRGALRYTTKRQAAH